MDTIDFSTNRIWKNWQNPFSDSEIDNKLKDGWKEYSPCFTEYFSDKSELAELENLARELKEDQTETIIVVGMGGSVLGTKAIKHYFSPYSDKLFFWEASHPQLLRKAGHLAEIKNAVFLWVSKSGDTLEANANLSLFRQFFPDIPVYYITAYPEKLKSMDVPEKNIIKMPEKLSGRYSVISSASVLPGFFLGADMNEFMNGFMAANEKWGIGIPINENTAKLTAMQYYQLLNANFHSVVFWVYADELIEWGRWLKHLWAESLGKSPHVHALPVLTQGPEDQHSMLQYFQDGPNSFIHTFIHTNSYGFHDTVIPDLPVGPHSGKSQWEILRSEMKSMESILTNKNRPVSEFNLPGIYSGKNPEEWYKDSNLRILGRWMGFWMYVVTYLGILFDVNPVNQPAIESGKDNCINYLTDKNNQPDPTQNVFYI